MADRGDQRERGLGIGSNREGDKTRSKRISKWEAARAPGHGFIGANRGKGSGRGDFARNTQRSRGELDPKGPSFVQRGAESQRGIPSQVIPGLRQGKPSTIRASVKTAKTAARRSASKKAWLS